MTAPLPDPIPAATVVLLREAANGGAPELLVVERTAKMVFAPGALVFPGGRVDAGDRSLAVGAADPDEAAARIAAVRETIEEVGIAIGIEPAPTSGAVASVRKALHTGGSFGQTLAAAGLSLATDALIPFARWRPKNQHLRIYDTRFYLARLPAGAPPATADETENVRLWWATAADVLAECDAGRASIIFPTRRNLERLALFAGVDAIEADARAHPVEVVTPWIEPRDGVDHLCIPEGFGYPVTSERLDRASRG